MSRRKKPKGRRNSFHRDRRAKRADRLNKDIFKDVCNWFIGGNELFPKEGFHGNVKWDPGQLVIQALIWAWHETRHVTDAFERTADACEKLGIKQGLSELHVFHECLERLPGVLQASAT